MRLSNLFDPGSATQRGGLIKDYGNNKTRAAPALVRLNKDPAAPRPSGRGKSFGLQTNFWKVAGPGQGECRRSFVSNFVASTLIF